MSFVIALAASVALLAVPGAAVALAAGARGLWAAALAGPISLAVIGTTGVLAALGGVPFAAWQPFALAVLLAAAAAGARRLLAARDLWTEVGRGVRVGALGWTAWALAAAIVAALFAFTVGDPRDVSQSYDGVFHLNAVAWILDTGDASSFDLYRMTHPGEDVEFYPAAWHATVAAVVQLAGPALAADGIAVATNAVWLASAWLVWLPGVALLTRVVAGRRRGFPLEPVAMLLGAVATAVPWTLLGWGTLYPTGLATILLPVGLALAHALLRRRGRARLAPLALFSALWAVAGLFAHPRALVSFVLLAAPLVLVDYISWARSTRVRPRGGRRVAITSGAIATGLLGVLAAGAIYVYRNFDVANRPVSDHLNGGPATATQGLGVSVLQALGLAVIPPDGVGSPLPQAVLAALAIAGVMIAFRSRRMRWIAIAWALAIVLYAAAAGSNSDLAKILTGVWYKDKFRLLATLGVVAVPLAAIGLRHAAALLPTRARAFGGGALALVAAGGSLALGFSPLAASVQRTFTPQDGGFIGPSDYTLMARLADTVPEGESVVGNPWDGSTLTWALGGRRAVFPHLAGEWTPDEITIAQRLDQAADDPAVCAAAERLGLHFVYVSPGMLWGSPAEAAFFAGIDRARDTPGVLDEVDREGPSALYRIAACDAPTAG